GRATPLYSRIQWGTPVPTMAATGLVPGSPRGPAGETDRNRRSTDQAFRANQQAVLRRERTAAQETPYDGLARMRLEQPPPARRVGDRFGHGVDLGLRAA